MFSDTFIEDYRLELQADIQAVITYDPGGGPVTEAKVVQEFQDIEEIYPCVVIDLSTGDSPPRHLGTTDALVVNAEIMILTVRPTRDGHIVMCSDGIKRSGKRLTEYLAVKIGRFLSKYLPSFDIEQSDMDIILDTSFDERDGVFKSTVVFEIMV